MDDEAVAAKLASLSRSTGKKRSRSDKRRLATRADPNSSATDLLVLPSKDAAPVFEVPEALRLPGAGPCMEHGRHVSLEELFPGTGLAEAWDTQSALRTAVRQALRDDLFAPLLAGRSAAQRSAALALTSAVMISWSNAVEAAGQGKVTLDRFTAAFRTHGITELDGLDFIRTIGALCGPTPHGSLIDIIPLDRTVAHSWHQDSGIPQNTVLLGFPPRDRYEGGGVFSSHVKLSHPLRPSEGEAHGAVVQYEQLPEAPPIGEDCILRPSYARGRELFISNDQSHLHSTPDRQCREALWRFM